MKKFIDLLRPLQQKIILERFLTWLCYLETAASAICLAVVLLSKWIPLPMVWLICAGILSVGLLGSICLTFWFHPVDMKETAEKADALGGAERMITTLELLDKENLNPVERLAVADGMDKAENMQFSKKYILHFPKRMGITAIMLILLTVAGSFLPVFREKEAEIYAKAQLERVEQVKEEMKHEDMTKEEKKEFAKVLRNLEKNMKQAKTKENAERAVQEGQKEMKRLEKKSVSPDLKKLAQALSAYDKNLAKSMEDGKAEEIARQWEKLASLLSSMTQEQKAALAEQLGESAEHMTEEELKKALEELEKLLKENADLEEALEQLKYAAQKAAQTGCTLRKGLQKANYALGQKGAVLKQPNKSKNIEKKNKGTGNGNNDGNGGNSNSGTGNGSGAGNGQGGNGRGFGHVEREQVYTRSAAGKSGTDVQLQGVDTEEGTYTMTEHRTVGERGEVLPYGQVYGQYKQEAMTAIENQNIPYGMKELVSEYFSILEQ